jgi:hypothetical protein
MFANAYAFNIDISLNTTHIRHILCLLRTYISVELSCTNKHMIHVPFCVSKTTFCACQVEMEPYICFASFISLLYKAIAFLIVTLPMAIKDMFHLVLCGSHVFTPIEHNL